MKKILCFLVILIIMFGLTCCNVSIVRNDVKMALEKIINKIDDDIILYVASTNSIAIKLYQRYGFTYDHTVSYFYKWEEK